MSLTTTHPHGDRKGKRSMRNSPAPPPSPGRPQGEAIMRCQFPGPAHPQGDRKGAPLQYTGLAPASRSIVRATLAVALGMGDVGVHRISLAAALGRWMGDTSMSYMLKNK